jgi:phosphatidylglycerophosphate synthase
MTFTPVILRATRVELPGANLLVGGLRVIDRAITQLGRRRDLRVIIVTDGTIPLPSALPTNCELCEVASDETSIRTSVDGLVSDIGGARIVGADVVRPSNDDLGGGVRVTDEVSRLRAEDAIFANLLRGDLGFVARRLNKPISFRVTRHILTKLPITPNHVTLGAAAIGLLGCGLIATGGRVAVAVGFLLAQLQSILDGCDGELARVRFQQTAIGEWLDTLVDDFLNLSLVTSMAVGMWNQAHAQAAIGAGGHFAMVGVWMSTAAGIMFAFYNGVSYRELLRQGVGGELIKIRWTLTGGRDFKSMYSKGTPGLTQVLFALGRRDTFVFGWMLLAFLNLLPLAALWALLVAVSCFGTAIAQLLLPREGS